MVSEDKIKEIQDINNILMRNSNIKAEDVRKIKYYIYGYLSGLNRKKI